MEVAPTAAMQDLQAADQAELGAEVSDAGVMRMPPVGDLIARVVPSPSGFPAEHDAARGYLQLRPIDRADGEGDPGRPLALLVGTEKGFTYRLAVRGDAIRSAGGGADAPTPLTRRAPRRSTSAILAELGRPALLDEDRIERICGPNDAAVGNKNTLMRDSSIEIVLEARGRVRQFGVAVGKIAAGQIMGNGTRRSLIGGSDPGPEHWAQMFWDIGQVVHPMGEATQRAESMVSASEAVIDAALPVLAAEPAAGTVGDLPRENVGKQVGIHRSVQTPGKCRASNVCILRRRFQQCHECPDFHNVAKATFEPFPVLYVVRRRSAPLGGWHCFDAFRQPV